MGNKYLTLTKPQKDWFADRIGEGVTGRILIPSYLYVKFRKLAEDESIPKHVIQNILIDECY